MGPRPRMRGRDGTCEGIGRRARKATGQGGSILQSDCAKIVLWGFQTDFPAT